MRKRTTQKRGGKYAAKARANGADRYGQFRDGRRQSGDIIGGRLCFAPKADS